MKWRISFIAWFLTFVLLVFASKLAFLCMVKHEVFSRKSGFQTSLGLRLPGPRGRIVDRNGHILCSDIPVYDLHCYVRAPFKGGEREIPGFLEALSAVLAPERVIGPAERASITRKLEEGFRRLVKGRRPGDYVLVKGISCARALRNLRRKSFRSRWMNLSLYLQKRYERRYMLGKAGAQLVGGIFQTKDGPHYLGLENLARKGGILGPGPGLKLKLGRIGLFGFLLPDIPSETFTRPGYVVTTLDSRLQAKLWDILEREAARIGPQWACALLMDPNTGELLAMASWPGFNPNKPGDLSESPVSGRRNHCIESRFPPGSTMKSFIVAAALEEGILSPDEMIDCSWNVPRGWSIPPFGRSRKRRVIKDDHPLDPPLVKVEQVIVQSSNIGAVKIGRRFRPERYVFWLERLGLDKRSGIGVPGEVKPDFHCVRRLPENMANFMRWDGPSISHGYAISVNLLCLASCYSALINGGYFIRPLVLKGGERKRSSRVLSSRVSGIIRGFLAKVVSDPRGTGYRMAGEEGRGRFGGKTGTSFVRTGSKRRYWAIFVGFAPVEKPRFLAAAVFYKENTYKFYGGSNAGPTVRDILMFALGGKGTCKGG